MDYNSKCGQKLELKYRKLGEEQVWEENQDFGFEHMKLKCVGSFQQSYPVKRYLSLWF